MDLSLDLLRSTRAVAHTSESVLPLSSALLLPRSYARLWHSPEATVLICRGVGVEAQSTASWQKRRTGSDMQLG